MSEYETKIKHSRVIPYGYKVSEEDNKLLIPIPSELDALEQAMKYLRTSSVREVQRWLVATTGRYLAVKNLHLKFRQWKKEKYGRRTNPPTED